MAMGRAPRALELDLLKEAVEKGEDATVKQLLEARGDPNGGGETSESLLWRACAEASKGKGKQFNIIAKHLIHFKADANTEYENIPCMFHALVSGDSSLVQELLDADSDANHRISHGPDDGLTPLFMAVLLSMKGGKGKGKDYTGMVSHLIAGRADVNAERGFNTGKGKGKRVLHSCLACLEELPLDKMSNKDAYQELGAFVVGELVAARADVNVPLPFSDRLTPIEWTRRRNLPIVARAMSIIVTVRIVDKGDAGLKLVGTSVGGEELCVLDVSSDLDTQIPDAIWTTLAQRLDVSTSRLQLVLPSGDILDTSAASRRELPNVLRLFVTSPEDG